MPIIKQGNIEIQPSAQSLRTNETGYTFYSYDKDSAVLRFKLNDGDNPIYLNNAKVKLLLTLEADSDKQIVTDAVIVDGKEGLIKYRIPESLLGYVGRIIGNIYIEFEDGSHSDVGRFTFKIKRSEIDDKNYDEEFQYYISGFEEVKNDLAEYAEGVKAETEENIKDVFDQVKNDVNISFNQYKDDIKKKTQDVEDVKIEEINKIEQALPEVTKELQNIKKEMEDFIINGAVYG